MITLRGKYGSADIMLDDEHYPEESVVTQLYEMLNHPNFTEKIAIMPDTHSGKGSVIGFTMPLTDAIVPNVVGVDISCGMLVVKIRDEVVDAEALDKFINERIPSGFNIHEKPVRFLKDYIGNDYAQFLSDVTVLSKKIGQEVCPMRSIGTLGGGKVDCHRAA